MGQGGLFGKLFGRKGAEAGAWPPSEGAVSPGHAPEPRANEAVPEPRVNDAVPELRVQDAVPPRVPDAFTGVVVIERWDQDESLRHVLGHAVEIPAVQQVLDLCDAVSGLMPSGSWREQMAALLADNVAGVDALRTIALRETPFDDAGTDHRVPFVRGVVEAVGLIEPGDAVPLLVRVAEVYGRPGRGREYRSVALTAVRALGSVGGERTLPALRQIKAEAKLGAVRRAASQELDRALGEAHLSRGDVPEWQAETFELDRDGLRVTELAGGYTVTMQLEADGNVAVFYRSPTGQRLERKPASIPADERLREAGAIEADLRTVVYAERFRLKQLMQDQRTLTYEDWMEFYLGNPVTGRLCRSLVWESSIDGGEHWRRFLPMWSARREAWLRLGADGGSHDISEESQVRVVHPKRIPGEEKGAWVKRLRELKLKQPFKQLDVR